MPALRRALAIAGWGLLVYLAGATVERFAAQAGDRLDYAHYLVHPVGRITLATLGLAFVCGFPLVRLLVPVALRRHEILWYAPVGAGVAALALTALGYLGLAFHVSLGVTLATAALASVWAARRRPLRLRRPGRPGDGALLWVPYASVLIVIVALIPLMRNDFLTVVGEGSDAHLAVGTAQFLQHHYPTSIHTDVPVNRVPLVWKSKVPIYYALAASSSLSGLEPFETISSLQALLLALAACGFFLVARELLGAGGATAIAAMLLVGMDRMVLHTAMHPYYNQMWGLMAMPYALVLAWIATRDGGAQRTRGTLTLLALFTAIEAFAYPLALPILVIAIAAFAVADRRHRRHLGERPAPLRMPSFLRRRRNVIVLTPVTLALLVPLVGVFEKLSTGSLVAFNPFASLVTWAGDLHDYFPEYQFLSLDSTATLLFAAPVLAAAIVLCLSRLPRAQGRGLATVLAVAVACAVVFRVRHYGYYFHFKLLAFVGPLAIVIAVCGLARVRRLGAVAIAVYLLLATAGTRDELSVTYNELPTAVLALRDVDRDLPAHASIRLDLNPGAQLWPAYLLYHHPLCSQRPLLDTSYPHVPISRRADYIVVNHGMRPPADAVAGPPAAYAGQFLVYRERADVPGPDYCSRRRVQTYSSAAS